MKFGVCLGVNSETIDMAEQIIKLGYDYIETNVGYVVTMTDEEVDHVAKLQQEKGILTPCANLLFPGDMLKREIHLVGPKRDVTWENEYIKMLMPRCAKLGLKTLVFGSGKARSVQDGYDSDKAFEELVDLCRRLSVGAAPYGITIVIEPLQRKECNMITTVLEGLKLVQAVNRENVKLLADIFHVYANGESIDFPPEVYEKLHHVHYANTFDRMSPSEITPELKEFSERLKQGGYDRTISLEGDTNDRVGDSAQSLSVLKKLFKD